MLGRVVPALALAALSLGLGGLPGAQAQGGSTAPNTSGGSPGASSSQRVDLAVQEVRLVTFSGTPILAGTQLPPGTQLKVLAVMRNLGSVPTPSCNARCTATGNGVSTATVPPLPVAGSYTVPFPTPITLRQATGWTGTVLVEANFDAGLAPHGRWFQEQSYANNQGTCSFALKKPTLFP